MNLQRNPFNGTITGNFLEKVGLNILLNPRMVVKVLFAGFSEGVGKFTKTGQRIETVAFF